ncbi:molybdate ABC transporter substrate-binding protein [Naasia lichenicola]|uniref:Molybdate ABC transporter substrate-binding protein n=1 Tax=Naasia lichenicola TaxID=2565933 RepID=A0A4S4FMV6_9MICO|nr:molybdate ABC transporter substrate-binding protein [Naasia lichenicola]THG31793.1 molybdate ABC transporter substrate-binding protein [Naasia lichenicola]
MTARRLSIVIAAGALISALMLSGCSSTPATDEATDPAGTPIATGTADELSGTIVVDAAASLTESFTTIANEFMELHPSVTVTLNFGGSSALATDIVDNGAPVDVFAAASASTMKTVSDAGLAEGDPVVFARNQLEIVTPADNPGQIAGLADFTDPDKVIAVCAVEVPCGAAAQKVFDAAGITASVDTYEQDVKAVLTKVELGEAQAGLVYVTDALAAGDQVNAIDFPEAAGAITDYPIAPISTSAAPEVAQAFVDYVLGDGASVIAAAGFAAP